MSKVKIKGLFFGFAFFVKSLFGAATPVFVDPEKFDIQQPTCVDDVSEYCIKLLEKMQRQEIESMEFPVSFFNGLCGCDYDVKSAKSLSLGDLDFHIMLALNLLSFTDLGCQICFDENKRVMYYACSDVELDLRKIRISYQRVLDELKLGWSRHIYADKSKDAWMLDQTFCSDICDENSEWCVFCKVAEKNSKRFSMFKLLLEALIEKFELNNSAFGWEVCRRNFLCAMKSVYMCIFIKKCDIDEFNKKFGFDFRV